MKKFRIFLCLTALFSLSVLTLTGIRNTVFANNTPQPLPFSQNWTNTSLITVNNDWSAVPGIVGYRGDDLVTATGVDPRTILADGSATPQSVIANQTAPDTFATGAVVEFEIANPTIALNGSGTADVPHIVLYLNTTGQNNVAVTYNVRDLDGSVDNAIQQINTQYRVGSTGDFINLPGGYVADATAGPSMATLVTPVSVKLPVAANNQPVVEVRIMTTNAVGNDEVVGIDDITAAATATPAPNRANVDFNGDGRSDWAVYRETSGSFTTYIQYNGVAGGFQIQFGLTGDQPVPVDFDGDGKDDVAVWRGGAQGYFYILRSSDWTYQTAQFGRSGDDPRIVGDYDGDGKADQAVFRPNGGTGDPCGVGKSVWYYRPSASPTLNFLYRCWGVNGDVPAPGDYDGDSKMDFNVRRNEGGQGNFYLLRSLDSTFEFIQWGVATDVIVPGDYDADGRADFCVLRINGTAGNFYILERDGGGTGTSPIVFGDVTTDFLAPGDYDGDGATDIAIWRPNADPAMNFFFVRRSSNSALQTFEWGAAGDEPIADWNVTGVPLD